MQRLFRFFLHLLCYVAFLITKRVWSISAAYIVAFLAAISRFDIEMLMWAGYPNVITLMLIPLTFYLYLEKDRFSKVPFFVSTSILAGSLFLTHSLSAAMFVAILHPLWCSLFCFAQKTGGYKKNCALLATSNRHWCCFGFTFSGRGSTGLSKAQV